jgi:hypothetical protein
MGSVEIKYNDSKKINKPSSQNSFSNLKCMYLNASSLDNKLDELKTVVDTYRPEIIGVSETWFKSYLVVNVPVISCKIMEGIIRAKVEDYLHSNNLLAIH